MQFMKVIFLLSCLLIVGHTHVNAAGLDLFKILDCAEIAIAAGGYVAVRAVPLVRDLAKCTKFKTDANADLDIKGFIEVVNQFLKQTTGSPKCLQTTLDTVKGYVQPYVQQITDAKCFP
uniref:Accessory gland protein 2 n=2 Tax=Drosophila arizonae TaxID=7263 RepID=A0A0B4UE51_DROAR|nr:accessory gland protein 2 [Drosophila arizonae]